VAVDQDAITRVAAALGGDIDGALDAIGVPAYLLDRHGVVRWQNVQAVALFGARERRAFNPAFAPEDRERARTEFAKKVTRTQLVTDFDAVMLTSAGGRVPVQIHSVAMEEGDRVVAVFGVLEVDDVRSDPASLRSSKLTPRQYEVLRALAEGRSTAQIAASTHLSQETVRNHVRRLLRALGVHSRLGAVAEARRRGLID
jgi:DNA-binding CsgD family transcriptional regulator